MKNYKDETIKKLCEMLNYLDDNGCLVDEDKTEYQKIITDYSDKYEAELVEESRAPFCHSYSNCYILRSNEDGEIIVKTYDDHMGHAMMRDVSKRICFLPFTLRSAILKPKCFLTCLENSPLDKG